MFVRSDVQACVHVRVPMYVVWMHMRVSICIRKCFVVSESRSVCRLNIILLRIFDMNFILDT